MLFPYKCTQQIICLGAFFPPPYIIQMNIKSYKAFLNILLGLQKAPTAPMGTKNLEVTFCVEMHNEQHGASF